MVTITPLQHVKIVPPEPRWVDYNPEAAGRIGRTCRLFSRKALHRPGHPYRGARFGKKWYMRMDEVRELAPPLYDHDDNRIIKRMTDLIDNDVDPDSTGSAGAVNELTIQKERNVTGQRVKWGLLSAAGLVALQTTGIL